MIYLELLAWLALNPILAIIFGVLQFCLLHFLYHKSGNNKAVKFIFGLFYSPQNFVVNATAISLIGWEWPRETTTTARLKRWKKEGTGTAVASTALSNWRLAFATFICYWINKADPGHCDI